MGATPGEKMNLLDLIRATREPSVLTGTTKEFVTGSKTNLISPNNTLDLRKARILDFLIWHNMRWEKTHSSN